MTPQDNDWLNQAAAEAWQTAIAEQAALSLTVPPLDEWIGSDVTIEEPQADAVSIIPFHLWPAQREALACIVNTPQVVVLKARQLGISWLIIAYAVWLCIFHANKTVLVFSKDQDSANEMVRRAKGIFQRLRDKPTELTVDNVTTIAWSNGSRFKSFAATKDAGSSFTASLTIIDEFAKMVYADELYTSVKPTIADGGKMIVVSTARGEGNPFHKLWDAAQKHLNSFAPIFLPWSARPDRTAEWYARVEADAISSAAHRQEYPGTADEAFQNVGEDRFLSSMALWDACREELPPLTAHEPLILGMDDADVSDSFALVGVTAHPTKPKCYAVRFVQEWTPPASGVIDHYGEGGPDWMIRHVLVPQYAVQEIVYDPHDRQLALGLMNDGIVYCAPFEQMSARLDSDKFLFDMIVSRRLSHDGNEALRRHIDNANRKPDPQSQKLRLVKRQQSLKIDLAVTLGMALYTANYLGM